MSTTRHSNRHISKGQVRSLGHARIQSPIQHLLGVLPTAIQKLCLLEMIHNDVQRRRNHYYVGWVTSKPTMSSCHDYASGIALALQLRQLCLIATNFDITCRFRAKKPNKAAKSTRPALGRGSRCTAADLRIFPRFFDITRIMIPDHGSALTTSVFINDY